MSEKTIKGALISVFHKDGLADIVKLLHEMDIKIYSTGGTFTFLREAGIPALAIEELTTYPSILGGRVKTLHPVVFGGILARRDNDGDREQVGKYNIPEIDLVIVDLYPFEKTVQSTDDEDEITEKIDIGGISLIRAAAKNWKDVLVVSSRDQYPELLELLRRGRGITTEKERKRFAAMAFSISSHYDTVIFKYFNRDHEIPVCRESINSSYRLRYGENPHQKAVFFGDPDEIFEKLHGREISYNNLLDIDSALGLSLEFRDPTFAIIKHNNACGVAAREDPAEAWADALACDPVSAFGGVIASNVPVDETVAAAIDKIFFEIILAPGYSDKALEILGQKKNRIILRLKKKELSGYTYRSVLNGLLWQERDNRTETGADMKCVTLRAPDSSEINDLIFANKIVKHTKSNAIVLAGRNQLYASGTGQTSRVDALRQAIDKAGLFGFDLKGAVMASDAFFPFADTVEIAHKAGITAVIQPGGSVRDQESIDYCNANNLAMVFTGIRHFKH